ncbi:Zinc finger BED domain-containing protein RICESLEEPER 3 [Glycine max]|nr:Zinc finger BED domain-containing protein RICESLEEPER 3 [Glycine max]
MEERACSKAQVSASTSIYVAFLSVLVGVAAVRDDVEAEKQLLVKILMHFFTHEGADMQGFEVLFSALVAMDYYLIHSSDHHTSLSSHQPTSVESFTGTAEGPNNEPMQQPPSMEVDGHGVSSTKTRGGRLISIVWNHFDKIKTVDGQDKAQCKYCRNFLGGVPKNGTKHLHAHMEKCIQKRLHDKGKVHTFLIPKVTQGRQELDARSYNEENARKDLVCVIIMHEYPLSIVNHVGFRRFLATLQPQFQCPSRNTIKKKIFNVYDFEKSIVMKLLDTNEGRVAITSDMWTTSKQKKGYMAVTTHYIDSSWTLLSRILRLIYVPSPHTSERLCNALVECLLDWNIDTKLSTITLDNYSTNDCMIEKIKNKLQLGTLIKEGAFLHIRCCAHILNLLEKFQETAKQLRIPCTKKLSLDCPTRWNSTYKMLDVAISYKDVFSRLKQRETQYSCFPSDSQWEFAKEVCKRLAIFNDITEIIFGTKYPTANIYFPQIFEIKMTLFEWVNSPNEVIQKIAEKMLQKFDSYWSVIHVIMGVATVLDPRYKMELLKFYFELIYPIDFFFPQHQDSTSSFESPDVVSDGKSKLCDYDRYIQRKKRERTSTMKTELDHYLEEEVLPRSSDFDILMWWKLNKYPTLQAIARDVLAIPISIVAFESTFSIGGHILTPHRSRLHYTTLEALMCSKSWLWNSENASKILNAYVLDQLKNQLLLMRLNPMMKVDLWSVALLNVYKISTGRGWGYPIPDGYGDEIKILNLLGIGYGYRDMLGSRGRGLGRQYPSPPHSIAMSTSNSVIVLSLHPNLAFKLTKARTIDNRVKVVHPKVPELAKKTRAQDRVSCLPFDLQFVHVPVQCRRLLTFLVVHHAISNLYNSA